MASLINVCAALAALAIFSSGAGMAQDVVDCKHQSKMNMHCIIEVFDDIFEVGTVTNECCRQLVNLGQACHEAWVKITLQKPLFRNNDTSVILSRSAQIWNKCTLIAAVSPSPSP